MALTKREIEILNILTNSDNIDMEYLAEDFGVSLRTIRYSIENLNYYLKKYDFPVINGSGTEGGNLGSDPMRIKDAIEKAYTNEGVLIFCDIGSSILNSEMAMEFLDESYNRAKVKIADAPIVKGTLMAMAINDEKANIESIEEELAELKNFNKV